MQARAFLVNAGLHGAPKTIIVWVCVDELFRSDGSTTYIADVRDVPEVRKLGPMINRLRVHHQTENGTSDFRVQVSCAWSMTGLIWASPTVVYAGQAGNGQWIGTWTNTDTFLGLNLRFSVDVSNVAQNPPVSGRVTIALEIELKS